MIDGIIPPVPSAIGIIVTLGTNIEIMEIVATTCVAVNIGRKEFTIGESVGFKRDCGAKEIRITFESIHQATFNTLSVIHVFFA